MTNINRKILDIKQLAQYLNCSTSFIYKLIYSNSIPYFRMGSKYGFDTSVIDRWIIDHHKNIEGGIEYGN